MICTFHNYHTLNIDPDDIIFSLAILSFYSYYTTFGVYNATNDGILMGIIVLLMNSVGSGQSSDENNNGKVKKYKCNYYTQTFDLNFLILFSLKIFFVDITRTSLSLNTNISQFHPIIQEKYQSNL